MKIETIVRLEDGDSFLYTAEAAAAQVLAALGANPTNDYATVIVQQNAFGESGAVPPPEGPPAE